MENTFIPVEVDLSYNHEQPSYDFEPIPVDLTYPTGGNVKYDKERSNTQHKYGSLNEWVSEHDISILHCPKRNNDFNISPLVNLSGVEQFMHRLFGQ